MKKKYIYRLYQNISNGFDAKKNMEQKKEKEIIPRKIVIFFMRQSQIITLEVLAQYFEKRSLTRAWKEPFRKKSPNNCTRLRKVES